MKDAGGGAAAAQVVELSEEVVGCEAVVDRGDDLALDALRPRELSEELADGVCPPSLRRGEPRIRDVDGGREPAGHRQRPCLLEPERGHVGTPETFVAEGLVDRRQRLFVAAALPEHRRDAAPRSDLAGRVADRRVQLERRLVVSDELVQHRQLEPQLVAVRRQLQRAAEMEDRLLVRVQLPGPSPRAQEVLDGVGGAGKVAVAGE